MIGDASNDDQTGQQQNNFNILSKKSKQIEEIVLNSLNR